LAVPAAAGFNEIDARGAVFSGGITSIPAQFTGPGCGRQNDGPQFLATQVEDFKPDRSRNGIGKADGGEVAQVNTEKSREFIKRVKEIRV